ncbi:hypothetical protein IXB50_09495 [Leptothoe spongobia TAU-MAC 1115]|uniref:Uncharacterized protein n=2 Tax=Leptothoe TaxID=2651725 RepID=A0A947DFW3_9CYAN|nr:hypothetical protein [Leptothoe spongobia TAU-MAC 1115]
MILPMALAVRCFLYDRLMFLTVLYVLLAFVYNIINSGKDQWIDLYYILMIIHSYIAAKISVNLIEKKETFPFLAPLIALSVVLLLYIYELGTGTVLNLGSTGVPSSMFNNPNDLATYLLVFTPLLIYCIKTLFPGFLSTTLMSSFITLWILSLGSRICILVLPVLLLLKFLYSGNIVLLFVTIAVLWFGGLFLSQMDWETILDNLSYADNPFISRTAERLHLFLFDTGGDNSLSYRLESYQYAFGHIHTTVLGSGTKNYGSFYYDGFGNDALLAINPHSFIIENMIAFGWLGTLLIGLLLGYIFVVFITNRKYAYYGVSTFIAFALASNVPSTIVRIPILFFPLFFFAHLCRSSTMELD